MVVQRCSVKVVCMATTIWLLSKSHRSLSLPISPTPKLWLRFDCSFTIWITVTLSCDLFRRWLTIFTSLMRDHNLLPYQCIFIQWLPLYNNRNHITIETQFCKHWLWFLWEVNKTDTVYYLYCLVRNGKQTCRTDAATQRLEFSKQYSAKNVNFFFGYLYNLDLWSSSL